MTLFERYLYKIIKAENVFNEDLKYFVVKNSVDEPAVIKYEIDNIVSSFDTSGTLTVKNFLNNLKKQLYENLIKIEKDKFKTGTLIFKINGVEVSNLNYDNIDTTIFDAIKEKNKTISLNDIYADKMLGSVLSITSKAKNEDIIINKIENIFSNEYKKIQKTNTKLKPLSGKDKNSYALEIYERIKNEEIDKIKFVNKTLNDIFTTKKDEFKIVTDDFFNKKGPIEITIKLPKHTATLN